MKQETKRVDTAFIVAAAPDLPHDTLNVILKWHFKAECMQTKNFSLIETKKKDPDFKDSSFVK